jgi:PucR family transcriptional regulator, purine catabolism regulatory protein
VADVPQRTGLLLDGSWEEREERLQERHLPGLRTGPPEYARPTETRAPVPLWLSTLLDDPGLGLEVVAGRAGVDARGPIRWAHIADTPDPTPWLEGGEVLLTTGLGVKDSPELQRKLIAGLAGRGVVAVGFGTGVSLEEVPPAMVEACDEHELPLFTVPYEVPFIAVTRRVSHHTFAEHYATLRGAVDLHRQVLNAVVSEQGVPGVLATVGQAMPRAALLAFDFSGRELGRYDPAGRADDVEPTLWSTAAGEARETALDHRVVTRGAVRLGTDVEAVVAAVTDGPLLEHEELLFEQGLAGVSLELSRGRSVRAARRARVDELLEEVVSGRGTLAAVERALDRLGALPEGPYRVLAVGRPEGVSEVRLCSAVEDALLPYGRLLVGRLDGTVHALVADGVDAAEALVEAMRSRGWPDPRVGRSRPKTELDALRAALREADVALSLDGGAAVRDVGELGLNGLLAGIRDDLGAEDFVDQVLGPVLEHDARESAHLIASLHAYLAHGCRPGPAAEELCIHRHTLAYRLDRIRDLTGRDPRAGEHLLAYGLALELLDRTTETG